MSIIFSITLVLITYFFTLNILLAILADENAEARDRGNFDKEYKEIKKFNKSMKRAAKLSGFVFQGKE